jgi:hypothetical protein
MWINVGIIPNDVGLLLIRQGLRFKRGCASRRQDGASAPRPRLLCNAFTKYALQGTLAQID